MNNILQTIRKVPTYLIKHGKIYIAYILAKTGKKYRDYWLISERGFDARDNGYWFYKYMIEKHPEQPVIYIITSDSSDFEKIKSLNGEYAIENSIKNGIAYFSSEALVTAHATWGIPKWTLLEKMQQKFNLFKPRGKKIFLQHGVIKDYIKWLTKAERGIDLFICGAKPEYEYIRDNYGYDNEEVKYTGLARYDNLNKSRHMKEKFILLMPTWRNSMCHYQNDDEFLSSAYYKAYSSLINNKLLIDYLEKTDTELLFYPHIMTQKWNKYFDVKTDKIKICNTSTNEVQELLIKCDMLITDYSSVFFDVAYLRKNIVFYQFDYEEYRLTQYAEGYFDYKNGLGDVYEVEDDLVQAIVKLHGKPLNEKYEKKIDDFFTYKDESNCNRIYDEIRRVLS